LREALGEELLVRWFRPPHGFTTPTLCRVLLELGWQRVGWSVDSRDYDDLTADDIVARVVSGMTPGAMVLLHERPGRTETLKALPRILQQWTEGVTDG
jgi:peptidoglycan/xylan/chitin deacetylase (PgdA/CDA1 family)